MSRYIDYTKAINNLDRYKDILEKRGVKKIIQYRTRTMKHFDIESLHYVEKSWTDGDSYWKLSNEFYGDPQYWYVIARFNNKPTEAHIKIGESIMIPLNLSAALQVVV